MGKGNKRINHLIVGATQTSHASTTRKAAYACEKSSTDSRLYFSPRNNRAARAGRPTNPFQCAPVLAMDITRRGTARLSQAAAARAITTAAAAAARPINFYWAVLTAPPKHS